MGSKRKSKNSKGTTYYPERWQTLAMEGKTTSAVTAYIEDHRRGRSFATPTAREARQAVDEFINQHR